MKTFLKFGPVLAIALVASATSFADNDHRPGGPGGPGRPGEPGYDHSDRVARELAREARQLDSLVQNSYTPYDLREAVRRLSQDADQFSFCTDRRPGITDTRPNPPVPGPGPMPRPMPDPRRGCDLERDQVLRSFETVELEMRGMERRRPDIFNQLMRVRDLVNEIRGGHDHFPVLEANGTMDGYPFNFSGRDVFNITEQCLDFGNARRMAFVRSLFVNGQRFDGGYGRRFSLRDACDTVARNARQSR